MFSLQWILNLFGLLSIDKITENIENKGIFSVIFHARAYYMKNF